jgi:hypothetical protein
MNQKPIAFLGLLLLSSSAQAAIINIDDVSATHMDVTVQWSHKDLGYDFGWAQTTSPFARAGVQTWKESQLDPSLDALTINIDPPFGYPVSLEVHFDDKGIEFADAKLSYFRYSAIPASVAPVPGGDGIEFVLDAGQPAVTLASVPVPDSSPGVMIVGCAAAFLWLSRKNPR